MGDKMLFDVDGNRIGKMSYQDNFEYYQDSLGDSFQSIIDLIYEMVEDKDVFNSAHLGSSADWSSEPLKAVSSVCANEEESGMLFGLLVWYAMMEDNQQAWKFKPDDDPNRTFSGKYYWRV